MLDEPPTDAPWLWIVTGPNGAGKSSYRKTLTGDMARMPWLSPDVMARQVQRETGVSYDRSVEIALGERMKEEIGRCVAGRESFIVETTVPGLSYSWLAAKLRKQGWKVGVIALNVASPDVAIERVHQRISEGGHYAGDVETAQRWKLCVDNLPMFVRESDRALAYDNTGGDYILVASGTEGALAMEPLEASLKANNGFVALLERVLDNNHMNLLIKTPARMAY